MNDEVCPHCGGPREKCWIDYPEDFNCIHVAIAKNGKMTLEEVAKRLSISLVRVSQIEKAALKKMHKRIKFDLSL